MLKYIFILVNMATMLVANYLFQNQVNIDVEAPREVVAGDEFFVTVRFDKGDINSFARFQQNIPAGIKLKPMKTDNAEYSFKSGKARFLWLRLPADKNEMEITYSMRIDQRLKGTFSLGGNFSFIGDNKRQTSEVEGKEIVIQPSPYVDNSIDINDFQDFINSINQPSKQVLCVREQPKPQPNGEVLVNLLIDKGDKKKFAKVQESIPGGYTAEAIKTSDGIFTFKNGVLKFLWMDLPNEPYFVVSYKLIPDNPSSNIRKSINGEFSYVENNITRSIDIVQREFNLNSATSEQIAAFIEKTKAELPVQELDYQIKQAQALLASTVPGGDVVDADTELKNKTENKEPETKSDPVNEDKEKTDITEKVNNTPQQTVNKARTSGNSYLLEPESGVYYRVQLAAGHRPVNIKRYFRKYKINEDVRRESHQGWYKYSIGSFYDYRSARDYRVKIWNTTSIDDAFVSAYNNGKRITVQEALMIANHKWYR